MIKNRFLREKRDSLSCVMKKKRCMVHAIMKLVNCQMGVFYLILVPSILGCSNSSSYELQELIIMWFNEI